MKITVNVTQEDIDLGCKTDKIGAHGGCMVWRAFQRCTEGAFPFAVVDWEGVYIYDSLKDAQEDEEEIHNERAKLFASMPPFVEDRIRMFDNAVRVEPFAFDIELSIGSQA